MVFWVAVIPDSDVQVNPLAGTARMHVRNLPELDYYSPDGNGDLAALGPTWQTGYYDSTVSIDVVWKGPVTRLVNVRDAANGFAGIFAENQATVTWSVNSDSGFSFVSNPGNFSTSVPEVAGVNGVSVPLNFFAQVGFERNGIFFPQGKSQGSAGSHAANALAPLGIGSSNSVGWGVLGGQYPGQTLLWLTANSGSASESVLVRGVIAARLSAQSVTGPSEQDLKAARQEILHRIFADWDSGTLWDGFPDAVSNRWFK